MMNFMLHVFKSVWLPSSLFLSKQKQYVNQVMSVCMYVCMYVRMYVCMYMYVCVYVMYVCTHACMCVCICMCLCNVCVCVYVGMVCADVCVCMDGCVYAYVCVRVLTHMPRIRTRLVYAVICVHLPSHKESIPVYIFDDDAECLFWGDFLLNINMSSWSSAHSE
jgi:nuclear pore complex protein Nup62